MKKFICFRNFANVNRLVYAAGGEKPSQPENAEVIPKDADLTPAKLDEISKAVDNNISAVEDYYKGGESKLMHHPDMPKQVKTQLDQLKQLKIQLDQVKANPAGARQVLGKIYRIFTQLEAHSEERYKADIASHDPLVGLGFSIDTPELAPAAPKTTKAENAPETKETQQQLVRSAVENIARAGGELTQPMLDALKTQFKGTNVLSYTLNIQGNPVLVFIERSPDGKGFQAKGVRYNAEVPLEKQASSWDTASFTYTHSFDALDNSPPSVPDKSIQEYVSQGKKGKKLNPTALG